MLHNYAGVTLICIKAKVQASGGEAANVWVLRAAA